MMHSISKNMIKNLKNILTIIIYIFLGMLPFLIIINLYPSSFNRFMRIIELHDWVFRLIRWGLIALLVLIWPKIIDIIGSHLNFTPQKIIYWKQQTCRIAMWLIIFEAIVVENIVGKLIYLL